jgi:hypothetical protein
MAQQATININVNSKDAQGSVDKLSQSINNAGGTAASLKAQLRQVTNELNNLQPGSARFDELSAKAGQLRDQIQDTNAVITATAGNVTENFGRALGNTIQLGVAGFQGLMAAQTLFGVENEDLQKTLAQMGALLNLSQAIETFGGLGDKLVEIKAGFTPILTQLGLMKTAQTGVAASTAAADAALVGEAVAADGAAVSTGFFAAALNALPLVAIVTALGLLVAGLVSYASSSGDATEKDKAASKQKELLAKRSEEQRKAQDAERQKVAESSLEYFNLIQKLKETNAGSKERQRVINEINSQYGTTLQNLKDENAFQSQLNLSVKEYIALQVLKVRQESKKKEEEKALNKLIKAQDKLNEFNREYAGMTEKEIKSYDLRTYGTSVYADTQVKLNLELEKANKVAEGYAITSNKLQEEINKLQTKFPPLTDGIKGTGGAIKDTNEETNKYADLLDDVKNKLEREIAVQQTSEKLRTSRLSGIDQEINSIEKLYGDERQSVIDRAIQRELTLLDERFKEEGKSEEDYITAAKEIRDNYTKYLLDSEKQLLTQLETYRQEDLDNVKQSYSTKEQIVLETTKNIQTQTQLLQIQFEKNEALRIIDESKKTEEEKNKAKLEVREKYAQQEIDLLNKNLDEQKRIMKLQLDDTLKDESKTAAEKLQAQADYDQKIVQATQETADKINEINAGVKPPLDDDDKLAKSLEKINEYADAIATAFNALSTTLTMINDQRFAEEENAISGRYEFEKQALENQLVEGVIAREQYDNSLLELEQQREQETLQLKKKEFDSNKKLNMANAVINGAQAVLQALGSAPPPINLILAALVGGLAAVQFGVISSQEFTAAGGGIVPGIGSGMVDTVPARLAPGETVINAQSSSMYPELLNSINMAGGGISLKPDMPATNSVNPEVKLFSDNKTNQPVRAYVVETDVTDTQKRINRIKSSAEF